VSPVRHNVTLPEGHRAVPDPEELEALTPTELEEAIAYELLGPVPYTMSPVRWTARVLAHYREELLAPLELVLLELPPEAAAQVRAVLEQARGGV
jgi:hypothetical protein